MLDIIDRRDWKSIGAWGHPYLAGAWVTTRGIIYEKIINCSKINRKFDFSKIVRYKRIELLKHQLISKKNIVEFKMLRHDNWILKIIENKSICFFIYYLHIYLTNKKINPSRKSRQCMMSSRVRGWGWQIMPGFAGLGPRPVYNAELSLAQPHLLTLCYKKKTKYQLHFCFMDILTSPKLCITHSSAFLTLS